MIKKFIYFVFSIIFVFSSIFVSSGNVFAAAQVRIVNFNKTPEKATVNQKIYFRVRVDGLAKSVYMTVDGTGKYLFQPNRNSSIWELEKKLSIVGIRKIDIYAVDKNGNTDKVSDTIQIIEDLEQTTEETSYEITTERHYTGNVDEIEDYSEETTEIYQNDDYGIFNGNEYSGQSDVDDEFFNLSYDEDLSLLDEIALNSVFFQINNPNFYVKGQKLYIDEQNKDVVPYIKQGYTLVPLRAIGEALSADVSWDEEKRIAEISMTGSKITIAEGSSFMNVNGNQIEIDVSAEISKDRIFIPIRAVSEAFNKNIFYYDKLIAITEKRYELTDKSILLIKDAIRRKG